MARKAKSKKPTRRDAVAMLGAGTVLGVAQPPSSRGTATADPHCKNPADVRTYKNNSTVALLSFSCCTETKHALLVGVKERNETGDPTPEGKAHLKPLKERLNSDHLLEYCFMIWGITGDQATELLRRLPEQLRLQEDKRGGSNPK